jgi:hypothetical protein
MVLDDLLSYFNGGTAELFNHQNKRRYWLTKSKFKRAGLREI